MTNARTAAGALGALLSLATPLVAEPPAAPQTTSAAPELLAGFDKRLIDLKADPCKDFFQYACGNFDALHPIPKDRSGYSSGAMLNDHNDHVLHAILDKAASGGASRTPNEQKIGDTYASCLDVEGVNAKGLKPLQAELDRIAAIKGTADLADLLGHYQMVNVNAFFNFGEQQDFKDARKQIAAIDQGGLGLPERDYYFRTGEAPEKTRTQYVQHIATILKLVGEPEAKATTDAQAVFKLETALAKLSLDVTARRDPNKIYHLLPVGELSTLAPTINWTKFLAATGTSTITEINVTSPDFFKGLNELMTSTDLETIKSYLRWQLVASIPSYNLPKAIDDAQFEFFGKALRGQPEQRARWKRCVAATDAMIGEAVGQVFVAQEFPAANKQATVQMVKDIEAAMDHDLDTLDWMSAETKGRAKAKLHAVADKIGYPDHWRDYSKLLIVRGDALGNAARAAEFENARQIAKIGKPVDRGEWGITPSTVDAYYNPSMNDINFPAGILQPPFYDARATDAVNYGHIGGIVGHELTHGFDDQGRQFDANGNLSDWWTADDGKHFDEKADCEVKEYGNFVAVGDVHVNGKLTLGENTADNGGLRLAYFAFLADAKRKSIDLAKAQDGYNPLQQFFIGYGQSWCGSARPEQIRLQVQTDPHSPRAFRVNGVVQNMPEFGKAFGCSVGQPMTPANACRVW